MKKSTPWLAAALLLLGLAGCSPPIASDGGNAPGTTLPEEQTPVGTTTLSAAQGETVLITESDRDVHIPAFLPAGSISFKLNNTGRKTHNLEIKGAGMDKKLDAPINAGASQIFDVELPAGSYEVTDPDDAALKAATLTVKS